MASNNQYSGNKFSLRSKLLDQIKRIEIVNKLIPKVGDILVTTWSNLIMGIATIGAGGLWISRLMSADGFTVVVKNIVPIIIIGIGVALVAFNVALTNPSFGSQFTTSLSFLKNKYDRKNMKGKKYNLRPFRLVEIDGIKEVIETRFKKNERFMLVYQVRGSVSPVSFDGELNYYAELNADMLANLDGDCQVNCINSIQGAEVKPKKLPSKASKEMIRRRNVNYQIVQQLRQNQQLKTTVVISARTINDLYLKADTVENAFKRGLVIGYVRLQGKEAKKALLSVFG